MRRRNPTMLEEAQERLTKIRMKEEAETIRVTEALGRVCVENIYAVMNQPPFPRSPLDGYAVRSQNMIGASKGSPVKLNAVECICAGMYPKLETGPGEAARVMAGAPVPEGADDVIIQERINEGSKPVEIHQPVVFYGNYCKEGEDTHRGALLMRKGKSMYSSHTRILSSQGIETIPAYSVPVVTIVATGDKLVSVGTPLEPGKIYDSNDPLLTARMRELGMKPFLPQCGGDDAGKLTKEIRKQLTECDVLITSDDVSVGVRDCMPYVTEALGADALFHGINVKPGSPMLAMIVEDKPVFCLSGNPFAATTMFEVLVRPVLERVRGKAQWRPEILFGILKSPSPKVSPCRCLAGGKIEGGKIWLPERRHSSGILSSMTGCNCLVDISTGSSGLKAGEQVKVMLMQLCMNSLRTAEIP